MNAVSVRNRTQKMDKTAGPTHLFNFPADSERRRRKGRRQIWVARSAPRL